MQFPEICQSVAAPPDASASLSKTDGATYSTSAEHRLPQCNNLKDISVRLWKGFFVTQICDLFFQEITNVRYICMT